MFVLLIDINPLSSHLLTHLVDVSTNRSMVGRITTLGSNIHTIARSFETGSSALSTYVQYCKETLTNRRNKLDSNVVEWSATVSSW